MEGFLIVSSPGACIVDHYSANRVMRLMVLYEKNSIIIVIYEGEYQS